MELKLEQITPLQLDRFIESPEEAYEWVMDDLLGPYTEILANLGETERIVAQMEQTLKTLPAIMQKEAERSLLMMKKQFGALSDETKAERKRYPLYKEWHVLHYALNGETEASDTLISQAILGGREIPDVNGVMGYGPVRYLRAEEVKKIAQALELVESALLPSKLDQEDAEKKNIYLAHTFDDPAEWEHLPELFEGLRTFYRDAAERGNALLIQMY